MRTAREVVAGATTHNGSDAVKLAADLTAGQPPAQATAYDTALECERYYNALWPRLCDAVGQAMPLDVRFEHCKTNARGYDVALRKDGVGIVQVSDSITDATEAATAVLAGGLYVWSGHDGRTMRKNASALGFVYDRGSRFPQRTTPELAAKVRSAVAAMPVAYPNDSPRKVAKSTKRRSGANRFITLQRAADSKVRTLRGGIEELLGVAIDCIEAGWHSVQLDEEATKHLAAAHAVGEGLATMDIAGALAPA